jgi:hypothetical protein
MWELVIKKSCGWKDNLLIVLLVFIAEHPSLPLFSTHHHNQQAPAEKIEHGHQAKSIIGCMID